MPSNIKRRVSMHYSFNFWCKGPYWAIPEKNQIEWGEGLRTYFFEKTPTFFFGFLGLL